MLGVTLSLPQRTTVQLPPCNTVGKQSLSTHGASPTANLSKDYGYPFLTCMWTGEVVQCLCLPQYRAQHFNETFRLLDNDLHISRPSLSTHGASPTANLSKDYGYPFLTCMWTGEVVQCLRLQYRAQHLNETFPLVDNDLPVGQQRLSTHGASPTANLSKDYGFLSPPGM